MDTSTVTQKGQIVIPAALRRKLGFEPGTKVVITEGEEGEVHVRPLTRDHFKQYAGLLPKSPSATDALVEERGQDREREEKDGPSASE